MHFHQHPLSARLPGHYQSIKPTRQSNLQIQIGNIQNSKTGSMPISPRSEKSNKDDELALQKKSSNVPKFIKMHSMKSPTETDLLSPKSKKIIFPEKPSGSMGEGAKQKPKNILDKKIVQFEQPYYTERLQENRYSKTGFQQIPTKSKNIINSQVQKKDTESKYFKGENPIHQHRPHAQKIQDLYQSNSYQYKLSKRVKTVTPVNNDKLQQKLLYQKQTNFQLKQLKNQQSIKAQTSPNLKFKKSFSTKIVKKIQNFIKIKQLGSGRYGKVILVRDKLTGFICAIKQIQKKVLIQDQITEQFIRQVKIQLFLNHPNIMKMYGIFCDDIYIYILLEIGLDKQLHHLLQKYKQLSQNKIAPLMRQICNAVNNIHSQNIIHRDIKPQNIVLHQNVIKLCDFGWSVHQNNTLRTTFCGTPLYVCPQILRGKQYDEKVDIWAIGIMMYQMIVGSNPFKITNQEQMANIIKQEVIVPPYITISDQARNFLDICLRKNPKQRASIRQLVQHQFFKKYPDKQSEKNKVFGL